MRTFHFQIQGEAGWEDMGAAVGTGDDPLVFAIVELRALYGGALAAGRYQAIDARSDGARWEAFELTDDGAVVRSSPGECEDASPCMRT